MTYFFSYDIVDNKRRLQISKALDQFGIRVQKSIFHCDISPLKAEELKSALLDILIDIEDSLLFFPICNSCLEKIVFIGNRKLMESESFEIL